MRKSILVSFALGLALLSSNALAEGACLYGTAKWRSGSKIDGSTTVSTSWNGQEAYPKNGQYRLCFDTNPKTRITVYVDGKEYAKIYVSGDTRLDIIRD